jgi:hypothetical protein
MELSPKMKKVFESILLEAEFTDTFNNVNAGDELFVSTIQGDNHQYQVVQKKGGSILMVDLSDDGKNRSKYIIDKNSLDGLNLKLWKHDPKVNNGKGEEIDKQVEKVTFRDRQSGKPTEIDVEGNAEEFFTNQEYIKEIPKFNNVIKNLDDGDVLVISTQVQQSGSDDQIFNDLYLRVYNISKKYYEFTLEDIQSGAEGEILNSMTAISRAIGGGLIYMGGKTGFFKEIDGSVGVEVLVGEGRKKQKVKIKGVVNVQNNNIVSDFDYDKDDKKFSKQELQDYLWTNKTFRKMMRKKPDIKDWLTGASEKGLMSLKNMVDKYQTKNDYLTKGRYIKFKLMSPTISTKDYRHKISNRDNTYYNAKVTDDRTLKMGGRGKGNWEIELDKEIDTNTYECEVSYCQPDGTCNVLTKDAIIKILVNG